MGVGGVAEAGGNALQEELVPHVAGKAVFNKLSKCPEKVHE